MSKWAHWAIVLEVALAALLFGLWQASWLAGGFMLLVLLLQVDLAFCMPAHRLSRTEEDTLP